MSSSGHGTSANLSATYDSPSGHKDFLHSIPAPQIKGDGSIDVQQKTNYLSELRVSSKKLQEDINKFLTEKMEEDKKTAIQHGQNGVSTQKSKDDLEEENYGEENAEDKT